MVIANNGCKMKDFVNNVVTEKMTLIKVIKTSVYHQKGVYYQSLNKVHQYYNRYTLVRWVTCSLMRTFFFFKMKKFSFIIN